MSKQEILLVEHQEELLKLESLLLTSRGYKVNAVSNGRAAIDYIANNKPDLVMLEVNLPGVSGFEVCQYIKSNEFTKDVPVILLSAEYHRLDFAKGEQGGADCYITKTCDVVIENMRPGVMARIGLGYEALKAIRPGLVMLSTCNMGQTGPRADTPGFGAAREGHILLQDHGDAVWFREVKVRRLSTGRAPK